MYNLTALQGANNFYEVASFTNSVTQELFFSLTILAIFFVLLLVLKKWTFTISITISSFACFLLSAILTYIKLVNIMFPLAFLILTALGTLYLYTAD